MASITTRNVMTAMIVECIVLLGLMGVTGANLALADEPSQSSSSTSSAELPSAASSDFPLRPGDQGPMIKILHDRLIWLGYSITETDTLNEAYGASTQRALAAVQRKFWLPEDGYVTRNAWERIRTIAGPVGDLPKACTRVTSICISTKQKLVRWVTDGQVRLTADARFGLVGQATARGTFAVNRKSRYHVSSLYDSDMPFSLFFHGGQAVHYSSYFKRDGYYGASHGCVNLRDWAKARSLFNSASIGTRVHVY